MNTNFVILVATLVFVFIVGGVIMRKLKSNNAAKEAQEFARSKNWQYESANEAIVGSYPQLFPLYAEGRSTRQPGINVAASTEELARDILYFHAGRYPGQSFTLTYAAYDTGTAGSSEDSSNSKRHFWHIVGLELPVPLPELTVRPRRKIDALERRLTKPIELSSDEFNSSYAVYSEHPPFAHDVFSADMMTWLMQGAFKNQLVLQDHKIYVFSKGRQNVEKIDAMLAHLEGFLARIPSTVWHKAQSAEYPRPERIKLSNTLNVSEMINAYKDWRDSK